MRIVAKTAVIGENVKIGRNVRIEQYAVIYDNVDIGDNTYIGPHCVIGERLADYYTKKNYKNPKTIIGKNSIIRAHTIIYAGCEFGEGFQTGHKASIREYSKFGNYCSFGALSQSDGLIEVGDYSRIHNNVFISTHTKIGKFVWIFPGAVTLDSLHPPCQACREESGPIIKDYAIVSANATIMPKVIIGENAVIAANSLVNRNIPAGKFAFGVPASIRSDIQDIICKTGRVKQPYPWKTHITRNFPWAKKKEK